VTSHCRLLPLHQCTVLLSERDLPPQTGSSGGASSPLGSAQLSCHWGCLPWLHQKRKEVTRALCCNGQACHQLPQNQHQLAAQQLWRKKPDEAKSSKQGVEQNDVCADDALTCMPFCTMACDRCMRSNTMCATCGACSNIISRAVCAEKMRDWLPHVAAH